MDPNVIRPFIKAIKECEAIMVAIGEMNYQVNEETCSGAASCAMQLCDLTTDKLKAIRKKLRKLIPSAEQAA
jgi:hypothetical protein